MRPPTGPGCGVLIVVAGVTVDVQTSAIVGSLGEDVGPQGTLVFKHGELREGREFAKDGFDGEESGIPALYTYFGQFVDEDITFDPMTTLIKHRSG